MQKYSLIYYRYCVETGKTVNVSAVTTDNDRKSPELTISGIQSATQQERLSYGESVALLRRRASMSQVALAEAANVTDRTIRNIEGGKVAGQADVLIRIFRALGVELEGPRWSSETQQYVSMLAPMIERIAPTARLRTISRVIEILSDAMELAPNVGGVSEPVDLHTVPFTGREAATRDNTPIDPERDNS